MYIINYKCLPMLYTTDIEHSLPQENFFLDTALAPKGHFVLISEQRTSTNTHHYNIYYDRNCVIKIETMYCAVQFF